MELIDVLIKKIQTMIINKDLRNYKKKIMLLRNYNQK